MKALEDRAGKKIVDISFRSKLRSWRHYGMNICFADGTTEYVSREKEPYLALFLQNVTLRPSCYNCRFRCAGASDITLSDLWNVSKAAPEMDDDRGVSGVYVNTVKGMQFFNSMNLAGVIPVDSSEARGENGGFVAMGQRPARRADFFQGAHLTTDLIGHMKAYVVAVPIYISVYKRVRTLLSKIKRRISR